MPCSVQWDALQTQTLLKLGYCSSLCGMRGQSEAANDWRWSRKEGKVTMETKGRDADGKKKKRKKKEEEKERENKKRGCSLSCSRESSSLETGPAAVWIRVCVSSESLLRTVKITHWGLIESPLSCLEQQRLSWRLIIRYQQVFDYTVSFHRQAS